MKTNYAVLFMLVFIFVSCTTNVPVHFEEKRALSPEKSIVQQVEVIEQENGIVPEEVKPVESIEVTTPPPRNLERDSVWVIDVHTMRVLQKISVGKEPAGVAVSSDGYYALVSNSGDDTVSVIDVEEKEVVATIAVGAKPRAIVVSPVTNVGVVANIDDLSVSVINLTSMTADARIPVSKRPSALVASPEGKYVFVASASEGVLDKVNIISKSVTGRAKAGAIPISIAIASDKKKIFVANEKSNGVSVIDAIDMSRKKKYDVDVGLQPRGIVMGLNNKEVYVVNKGDGLFSVIDTEKYAVEKQFKVGVVPIAVLFVPSAGTSGRIFVTDAKKNEVVVIDRQTWDLMQTIHVGENPVALAATKNLLFVVNQGE